MVEKMNPKEVTNQTKKASLNETTIQIEKANPKKIPIHINYIGKMNEYSIIENSRGKIPGVVADWKEEV